MNFKLPYNRTLFSAFLRQLLPDDFELSFEENLSIRFQPKYISRISLLGKTTGSSQIKVYEAEHNSENDPRVSLSREIFKIMAGYGTGRALVIFRSSSSDNYRFSLVTIDLRLEGSRVKKEYSNPRRYSFYLGPDAKVATPDRYLTLKGRVADFNDLHSRFSVEVVNKEFYNAIAKSFSKLVGGKRKIGSHVEEFKGALKLPSKASVDNRGKEFAVRLIGRIIFCWFLKKKTSSTGSQLIPDELLSLDAVKKKKDFYHFMLEPLFFQVLNTPNEKRIDEYRKGMFSNIPFLNGGLFEPHQPDDWYETSDNIFGISKYINTLKVPDEWFFDLFETLELYNFTIDENTTIDVDLSVDPEMLGRIFENLLAEINPETEESARKSTGSYYTPRPIVDYMVSESLKQYLLGFIEKNYLQFSPTGFDEKDKQHNLFAVEDGEAQKDFSDAVRAVTREKLERAIDSLLSYEDETAIIGERELTAEEKAVIIDALDKIKIIDPACGSGAFPMGILQKMVLMLQKVDPDSRKWLESVLATVSDPTARGMMRKKLENEKDLWDYTRKIGIIRKSIYGVDIQPIAVEIAKLRCFLSLIVEEKVIDEKENRNIEPLPNLDFKFVCANSLINVPEADESDTENTGMFADTFFSELENHVQNYFQEWNPDKKKELHAKIEKLIDRKVEEKEENLGNLVKGLFGKKNLTKQQEAHQDSLLREQSLWESYKNIFKGEPVGFFNIKYFFPEVKEGFDVVIANPPYVQIQSYSGQPVQKALEEQNYESFAKTGDIYCLFYERGFNLLRRDGVLTYITSNKWMRAKYGEGMRKFFAEKSQPLRLIDFGGYKVFESATVDTNILIVSNPLNDAVDSPLTACKIEHSFTESTDLSSYIFENSVKINQLSSESWVISSSEEYKIKKRIEEIGIPLKDWDISINYGIKTGLNDAFIIDGKKKDELIAKDPKSAEIIKPILRGRDIKRYKAEFADLWLIFIPWHFPMNNDHTIIGASEKAEILLKKQYAVIYKHLCEYKEALTNRNLSETGIRYEWYALQRCAATYYQEFEKDKIVYPDIMRLPKNADSFKDFPYLFLDKKGFFVEATNFLITGNGLHLIIAVLSSKLGIYSFTKFYTGPQFDEKGFRFKKEYLQYFPIPQISTEAQQPFEVLVDYILFAKEQGMEKESSIIEKVIDGMVYDLYFTEEMKKAKCYITDRITGAVKPFKMSDRDSVKKELIASLCEFCSKDKILSYGLAGRAGVKEVQIVEGVK